MSDNLIFPDSPGGLPSRDPSDDSASIDGIPAPGLDSPVEGEGFSATFDEGADFGPIDFGDDFSAFDDEASGDGADGLAVSFAEAEEDSDDGGEPEGKKKDKKARRAPRTKEGLILGVHVTPHQVYGVLVRPAGEDYEPLRQFVRNRSESQFGATALSPDDVEIEAPEMEMAAAEDDVLVQFGGAGEIDFSAEFAGMDIATDAALDMTATAGAVEPKSQPIIFELRDMLEECEQAGFARPALAFAIDAPDVAYAEVVVPPDKKKSKKPKKSKKDTDAGADGDAADASSAPVKRDRLIELTPDMGAGVDVKRAAFLPMTPRDGLRRYMAVAPASSEPVVESLQMLREQSAYRKTQFKTLEAEVPLLVGLVRETSAPESHENTAIVRVGAEDTIVLLLTGGDLHHYEQMPSVTAFDGPDTICSRVLLQQDVQGVGTVHNVVIVAEEREKELVQGFAAFYPEARVETLREGLARLGLVGPYGPLAPVLVEAAGVAVAGHRARQKGSPFADVNLLPAELLKKKRRLDFTFSWHTLVVAMALFLSVLYFSYLYVSQEGEIADAEQRLAEFPPETQMSVPQLQARIDSLRGRQQALTAALVAMDSLLIDTDRWTQTTLRATRAAAQTGGIWIEQWQPAGQDIALQSYATTRNQVVGLAQRLDATIEEVTFQALREYPVYEYRMRFTQPRELPQITRVLREQASTAPPEAPAPLDGIDAASL